MLRKLLSEKEDTYEIANEEEGGKASSVGQLGLHSPIGGKSHKMFRYGQLGNKKDGLNSSTTYFAVLSVIPDRPRGTRCVQ